MWELGERKVVSGEQFFVNPMRFRNHTSHGRLELQSVEAAVTNIQDIQLPMCKETLQQLRNRASKATRDAKCVAPEVHPV